MLISIWGDTDIIDFTRQRDKSEEFKNNDGNPLAHGAVVAREPSYLSKMAL